MVVQAVSSVAVRIAPVIGFRLLLRQWADRLHASKPSRVFTVPSVLVMQRMEPK